MGLGLGSPSGRRSAAPSSKSGGELALPPEGVAPPVFDDRILGATTGMCRTPSVAHKGRQCSPCLFRRARPHHRPRPCTWLRHRCVRGSIDGQVGRHARPAIILGLTAWIPERSATRLREANLNVFSKLGNQGLEWRLEPEAFTGREVRCEDDLLDVLVGMSGRYRGGAAAIGVSVHWRFRRRLFAMRHERRRTRSSCRAGS